MKILLLVTVNEKKKKIAETTPAITDQQLQFGSL